MPSRPFTICDRLRPSGCATRRRRRDDARTEARRQDEATESELYPRLADAGRGQAPRRGIGRPVHADRTRNRYAAARLSGERRSDAGGHHCCETSDRYADEDEQYGEGSHRGPSSLGVLGLRRPDGLHSVGMASSELRRQVVRPVARDSAAITNASKRQTTRTNRQAREPCWERLKPSATNSKLIPIGSGSNPDPLPTTHVFKSRLLVTRLLLSERLHRTQVSHLARCCKE